jgi:pimeloyl-ACP methyl ester carboxylesterase
MTSGEARDGELRLRDGRTLAYRESGAESGRPVLYFHGNPGSRLDTWGDEGAAAAAGVRLIAVDRPGIGRSDPQPGRRLLDWPADVAQLADALSLDRFAVIGYSAGGPYALACAHRLPERIASVALLAAMGPIDTGIGVRAMGKPMYWRLARRARWAMQAIFSMLGRTARDRPERAKKALLRGVSDPEKAVLSQPRAAERVVATLAEATRQGGRGLADDMRVLLEPWGFSPGDVRVSVALWQGDQDTFVRDTTAEAYAQSLAVCRVTACPGEGHFFLDLRMNEILAAV